MFLSWLPTTGGAAAAEDGQDAGAEQQRHQDKGRHPEPELKMENFNFCFHQVLNISVPLFWNKNVQYKLTIHKLTAKNA